MFRPLILLLAVCALVITSARAQEDETDADFLEFTDFDEFDEDTAAENSKYPN